MKIIKEKIKIKNKMKAVYTCISGSYAYGLNTKYSDKDYRGIILPSKEYILGLKRIEQLENNKQDMVFYELRKFVNLALQNNPNIIELLYIPSDCIIKLDDIIKPLFENRDLFLSKRIYKTFSGYAYAQLRRIKRYRKYLQKPITKPSRKDYGLTDKKMPTELINAILFKPDLHKPELINLAKREREYNKHLKEYKMYQQYLKNRNPERKEIEIRTGYDTKNAMHLFRLLNMSYEIIKYGIVKVRRTDDKKFLMDIRKGKYTYEEIISMAEEKFKEIDKAFKNTKLRSKPDYNKIEKIVINILEQHLHNT